MKTTKVKNAANMADPISPMKKKIARTRARTPKAALHG